MQSDLTRGLTILSEAKRNGIVFFLEDGKVKYKIPAASPVDPGLIRNISTYRNEIKQLLQAPSPGQGDADDTVTAGVYANIPLSFGQESLWFIHQLEGSVHYHISRIIRLKGNLDTTALAEALKEIVRRHAVLRTVFMEKDQQLYQYILPPEPWDLQHIDGGGYASNEPGMNQEITALLKRPFDLRADYMIRAYLLCLAAEEHLLIVNMHHIAIDGWSWGIFMHEMTALYEANTGSREATLPKLPIQYADHAIRQRRWLRGEVLENKITFWKEQLHGYRPFELRPDYLPAVRLGEGRTRQIVVDNSVADELRQLSRSSGATLYMTLLAAFKVLLYRYSGVEDIGIGTQVAGRTQPDMEGLMGFFVNSMVLRSRLYDSLSFRKLLGQLTKTTLDAYEHQDLPFEKVVEAVTTERGKGKNPLFRVVFNIDMDLVASTSTMGKVELLQWHQETGKVKYDLMMTVVVTGLGLTCHLEYDIGLYKEETVDRLLRHYSQLLQQIAADADEPIGNIHILAKEEEEVLLGFGRSDSGICFPVDKTVDVLISEQALRSPDSTAVMFKGNSLSYRELEYRANHLCHYLRNSGVERGSVVGLSVERGMDMIVGLLAILKAGAAFVPMHTGQPEEQLRITLEETGAPVCLVDDALRQKLFFLQDNTRLIDIRMPRDGGETRSLGDTSYSECNDLAYILYTSGSTGRPKGVMIEHRGIVSHVSAMINHAGLGECGSFAMLTSFLADSVYSILFTGLINGSTLHIIPEELVLDGRELACYLELNRIDCLKATPGLWMSYASNGDVLLPRKVLMLGGEVLPSSLAGIVVQAGYGGELYNHYGPAEVTIGATLYKVDLSSIPNVIPIGRPYPDRELYVVNACGRLCPIGVAGELWIGGNGTARGYLGRPDLTAKQFVPNKYSSDEHARLYITGDRVRWLDDGNVEFLGRMDEQIKMNGYRIEPGEVEAVILRSGWVKQVVVLCYEAIPGVKRLAVYLVAHEGYERKSMLNWLGKRLPRYKIPDTWVLLDELPLLPSGKVDKAALPPPHEEEVSGVEYQPPQTRLQSLLADTWAEALGLDRVGILDNFFAIGGHSLMVVNIVGKIRTLGYNLWVGDIFDHQTVESLSAYLESQSAGIDPVIPSRLGEEYVQVLNEARDGVPVVIIPGLPGFCEGYVSLARNFGGLCQVYGIQLPGLKEGEKTLAGIGETADFLMGCIRRVQPGGPYRIIGHSLGAHLGFELIRRLEQAGEETGFLVLLDAYIKKPCVLDLADEGLLTQTRHFLKAYQVIGQQPPPWFDRLREGLASQAICDKPAFIVDYVGKHIAANENTSLVTRALSATLAYAAMRFAHVEKIRTPLLVIKAEEGEYTDKEDDLGWTGYSDMIHIGKVTGTHTSLLNGSHGEAVVQKIIDTFLPHNKNLI